MVKTTSKIGKFDAKKRAKNNGYLFTQNLFIVGNSIKSSSFGVHNSERTTSYNRSRRNQLQPIQTTNCSQSLPTSPISNHRYKSKSIIQPNFLPQLVLKL